MSEYEKNIIVAAIQNHDTDVTVWLFGSRADDKKKGGDIDIADLSHKIGEQHIDLFIAKDATDPFWGIAVEEGIQLNEEPALKGGVSSFYMEIADFQSDCTVGFTTDVSAKNTPIEPP